jgi:preprotein translocase subunit SecA
MPRGRGRSRPAWSTRSIENAQRKVEARNFDIRKQLLEYDDVANDQRKVIYAAAQRACSTAADLAEQHHRPARRVFTDLVRQHRARRGPSRSSGTWPACKRCCTAEWARAAGCTAMAQASSITTRTCWLRVLARPPTRSTQGKVACGGWPRPFTGFERSMLLQTIDHALARAPRALDYLRQGIHLRGYAQKNPKQEYKREAFQLFGQMFDSVKHEATRVLMTVRKSEAQDEQPRRTSESASERISSVTCAAPTRRLPVEVRAAGGGPCHRSARPCPASAATSPCPCGSWQRFRAVSTGRLT